MTPRERAIEKSLNRFLYVTQEQHWLDDVRREASEALAMSLVLDNYCPQCGSFIGGREAECEKCPPNQ